MYYDELMELICVYYLSEIKKQISKSPILDLSAQLAYYFLISFFPFLLLLFSLIGYLSLHSGDVVKIIHSYLPSLSNKILKTNLDMILDKESLGLFSFSLIATLYLASVAFHSLIRVLDSVYNVRKSRTLWREWVMGVFLMLGLLFGLVLSLVLSVFGDVISNSFFQIQPTRWGAFWTFARWAISSFILIGLFLCLYVFAPNVKVFVRDAIPGSIFATFAWQISSLLFSYYIDFVDYSYLYGQLASAMILVGWFYWSSLVLVIGGLINSVFTCVRNG